MDLETGEAWASRALRGVEISSYRWTPERLAALMARLRLGSDTLRRIPRADLERPWDATVEAFLDPASPERRAIDPVLATLCRLSPEGLAAGLEAVLGGQRGEPAARLFAEAGEPGPPEPVVIVLASNLPALAVPPLLPALALRRPVLLKSPSAEPLFAPAFLDALVQREPRLGGAVAAATWSGGAEELEAPVLAAAGTVIAYGGAEALVDLERRAPGKVVGYGPKTSLAVIGAEALAGEGLDDIAEGLARDVALFDQRGCLSIVAIYTDGEPIPLAEALTRALERAAHRWPPGPVAPAEAASVQQLRLAAELEGRWRSNLPLSSGTVLVEPRAELRPSPGLRTLRIHPLEELEHLPEVLRPWAGQLQGAALAGDSAWALQEPLAGLGISRFARPGELQSPDAAWHNGGISPLAALRSLVRSPGR
jgi:hypothetical protein